MGYSTASSGGTGPTGPAGADGTDGSVWHSGTGVPSGALGVVTDWYLNDANGDVYEKTGASTWTLRDNLTGPTGNTGNAGAPGTTLHSGLSDVTADQHHARDHTISGSTHTGTLTDAQIPASIARDTEVTTAVSDHAALADPHTGYRLESADHTHATTGLQGGTVAHSVLTGVTADQHHARLHSATDALDHSFPGGTTTFLRADGTFAAPTAAAADPVYSPGSFTVVTESGRYIPAHLKLTTTQRATIEGTGRLVIG